MFRKIGVCFLLAAVMLLLWTRTVGIQALSTESDRCDACSFDIPKKNTLSKFNNHFSTIEYNNLLLNSAEQMRMSFSFLMELSHIVCEWFILIVALSSLLFSLLSLPVSLIFAWFYPE
jgi:hypothetical protein